jgi:hypothetical protein
MQLKEEVNRENDLELSLLRDEETYFREQCRLLLEQGKEREALQFDEMANEVADEIETIRKG